MGGVHKRMHTILDKEVEPSVQDCIYKPSWEKVWFSIVGEGFVGKLSPSENRKMVLKGLSGLQLLLPYLLAVYGSEYSLLFQFSLLMLIVTRSSRL